MESRRLTSQHDMPMKTVVTGACGATGRELCRLLHANGADVDLIGHVPMPTAAPGEHNVSAALSNDIQESIARAVHGADVVYHLASADPFDAILDPLQMHDAIATSTLRLLQTAHKCGVGRFVFVSSADVYGEPDEWPISESCPASPLSVAASARLAAENYCAVFRESYGLETTVVRQFNVFGPPHGDDSFQHDGALSGAADHEQTRTLPAHCHSGVIDRFTLLALADRPLAIFGDGSQTRDFLYVTDAARGILEAGVRQEASGETFNLGTGIDTSIGELAELVREVTNVRRIRVRHTESRTSDVRHRCADTGKAIELLGFSPEVSLPEGLARVRDWYQCFGKSPQDILAMLDAALGTRQRTIDKRLVAARPVDDFERIRQARAEHRVDRLASRLELPAIRT